MLEDRRWKMKNDTVRESVSKPVNYTLQAEDALRE